MPISVKTMRDTWDEEKEEKQKKEKDALVNSYVPPSVPQQQPPAASHISPPASVVPDSRANSDPNFTSL